MLAQNNLRYSHQTAAGGNPGVLRKLQMKSVALAKINQIARFGGDQPNQIGPDDKLANELSEVNSPEQHKIIIQRASITDEKINLVSMNSNPN